MKKNFFLIVFLLLFLWGCSVNPVTGKRELILVSTGQEKAIGAKSDKEIIKQYGLYNDEKLSEYVNSVGKNLLKYVHRHNALQVYS